MLEKKNAYQAMGRRAGSGLLASVLIALMVLFGLPYLTACSSIGGGNGTPQPTLVHNSARAEINDVKDVPKALSEAMKEIDSKMLLKQDETGHYYLYEDSERVGEVELFEEDYSFAVYIDENETDDMDYRALERVADMTVAEVLACNPDYDEDKARDVSTEVINSDGEYRDGRVSYKVGSRGYQYVLMVYL